jgi:soluble lytic murein transglycosylase-like protein
VQRVGLDPLRIVVVIAVESRFDPIAESDAGAHGPMKVIPGYHKDRMEAAFDPHDNIRLGAQILEEYIRRGGTEVAGLQIYNGVAADASNAYAVMVLGERQRLQQAVQRLRDRPLSSRS